MATSMPKEPLISIIEIAQIHGRRKQIVHKIVGRLGLRVHSVVAKNTRGQKASHITVRDYETHRQRFETKAIGTENASGVGQADAVFYVILTEPRLDPGRFKLGFSANVSERLRSHRTSAPFSELVRTWPCKALWEKTAIDCIAAGCEQVGPEVFRTEDIQGVIWRANQFFKLMPTRHE